MSRPIPSQAAFLALLAAFASASFRCAAPRPGAFPGAPPATPTPAASPGIAARAEEAAVSIANWLLLDAAQKEKVRAATIRLLERNAQTLSRPPSRMKSYVTALSESSALFEAELMAALTPDQRARFAALKLRFSSSPRIGPGMRRNAPFPTPSASRP